MEVVAIEEKNNGIDERDYFTLFVAFESVCSRLVTELLKSEASDKHTKLLMAKYLDEVTQHLCIKSRSEIDWLAEDIDQFFEDFFKRKSVVYEEIKECPEPEYIKNVDPD